MSQRLSVASIFTLALATSFVACAPPDDDASSEASGAVVRTAEDVAATFKGAKLTFKKDVDLGSQYDPRLLGNDECGVINETVRQPALTIKTDEEFQVALAESSTNSVSLALTQLGGKVLTPPPALRLICRNSQAKRTPRYDDLPRVLQASGGFAVLSK